MFASASDQRRVYLDHAATTPLRPRAQEAWLDTVTELQDNPGNPSSLHAGGRSARRKLEDARERLAHALGAERAEVIFTSGATESAALGIVGGSRGRISKSDGPPPWLWLYSGLDHPAVREQVKPLDGFAVTGAVLPSTHEGVARVDEDTLARITAGYSVALGSLTTVCSETGTVQPVAEFASNLRAVAPGAYVHSDATQAVGNVPVSFSELNLDLMTIGGHKFGAPVGTGALLVKRGVTVISDRFGGGQERGLRSGTADVAGAVALSVAAEDAVANLAQRTQESSALRAMLLGQLPEGVRATTDAECAPSIVHLSLPTAHPEILLLEMDRLGVCVSAGSACHAGVTRPSSVLLHMGRSEAEALGVLRVSFGLGTTEQDVTGFLEALPFALEQAQRMDEYDQRGGSRNVRPANDTRGKGVNE